MRMSYIIRVIKYVRLFLYLAVFHIGSHLIPLRSYYVIYPYSPCDEDELALAAGDIVYVTESFDDGWLVGISQRTNEYGSFPSTCVCKLRVKQRPNYQLLHQPRHQHRHQLSLPVEL
jgi:Variant SH3 domain